MIVGTQFDGDDWDQLKWLQHNLYGRALRLIIDFAAERYRHATIVLDMSQEPKLQMGDSVDHRSIQPLHDHIAGYWRQKHGWGKPDLFRTDQDVVGDWLPWLREALQQSALHDPWFSRALIGVIVQNNEFLTWWDGVVKLSQSSNAGVQTKRREWNDRLNALENGLMDAARNRFPVSD